MTTPTTRVPRAAAAAAAAALVLAAVAVTLLVRSGDDAPATPAEVVGLLREDDRPLSADGRADVDAAVDGLRASGPDGRAAAAKVTRPRAAGHGYTVFAAGDRVCIGGVGSQRQYACAFSDVLRDGRQALALPVPLAGDRTRVVVLVADGVDTVRVRTSRGTADVPVEDNLAVREVDGRVERVTWTTAGGEPAALTVPGA